MIQTTTYEITTNEPKEIPTGMGLWRIELKVKMGKELGDFEIWAYSNFIASSVGVPGMPMESHTKKFAELQFSKWYKDAGDTLPTEKALIFSTKGDKITTNSPEDYIFIPKQIRKTRTNINLPPDLYDWAKRKAFDENISLSELVGMALSKNRSANREETENWFLSRKEKMMSIVKKEELFPAFMEITHYLPESHHEWTQSELLTVARNSMIKHTGWPIGIAVDGNSGKPHATEYGVEAEYVHKIMGKGLDYWYLNSKGDYYFARNFDEDSIEKIVPGTLLWFDIRIRRIAEAIEHCVLLYNNLEISDTEAVRVKVSLFGVANRKLSAYDIGRASTLFSRVSPSTVNQISWEKEMAFKTLKEKQDDFIHDAARQLLVIFDFFSPEKQIISGIVDSYRSKNF